MKQYKSLGEAQRSLALQVLALTMATLLFVIAGRYLVHNRFTTSFALRRAAGQKINKEDITIKFEEEPKEVPTEKTGQEIIQEAYADPSAQAEPSEPEIEFSVEESPHSDSSLDKFSEAGQEADSESAQEETSESDQEKLSESDQEDIAESGQQPDSEQNIQDNTGSGQEELSESGQEDIAESGQQPDSEQNIQDNSGSGQDSASESGQQESSDSDQEAAEEKNEETAADSLEKTEDQFEGPILNVSMLPHKAGKYAMTVADRTGRILLTDDIYVGKYYTAFSKETGSFTGDETLILAGILYYIGLCIIMLIFLRRLSTPLSYSYEAILSCGIFIFALVALIIQVPVYIRHLLSPETCSTWQLIYDFAAGGKYFTIFTAPIVIVFSILLIISNIALLQHERPRFQNFLGLLLGILLIIGEGFYYLIYSNFSKVPPDKHLIATTVINIIGITFTYVECILFSSMICGVHAAKHVPNPDRDYILILGCGFRKDGSLPPLLRGRVDKAMEFWHKQKESTGKEAVIIPSGGQGKDECMAEADAMYRYMVASGFPDESIIRENQSANTYQNMEFSKKIIDTISPDKNVNTAFVTTNYHVFRSGVWAGQAGLDAEGIGSRTKWWFWPNAFVRECVGLLYNRLLWELFYLAVLIFIFSLITRLAYL